MLSQTWRHTPVSFKIKFFCRSGFLTVVMHPMPLCYEQWKLKGHFCPRIAQTGCWLTIFYSLDKRSQLQRSQISLFKRTTDSVANMNPVHFPPHAAIRQHKWQQHLHPLHLHLPQEGHSRTGSLCNYSWKAQYFKGNFIPNRGFANSKKKLSKERWWCLVVLM